MPLLQLPHCSFAQHDVRKRIDKRGTLHDAVADVKDHFADTRLLELVLLADPAAINAKER